MRAVEDQFFFPDESSTAVHLCAPFESVQTALLIGKILVEEERAWRKPRKEMHFERKRDLRRRNKQLHCHTIHDLTFIPSFVTSNVFCPSVYVSGFAETDVSLGLRYVSEVEVV